MRLAGRSDRALFWLGLCTTLLAFGLLVVGVVSAVPTGYEDVPPVVAAEMRASVDHCRSIENPWYGPMFVEAIVSQTIEYERQSYYHGIEWAWTHKRGDCSERAAIMAWMLRDLGYDAHIVHGWIVDENGNRQMHDWVELTIPLGNCGFTNIEKSGEGVW
jgi:transglutaminase-like putative cysteine protease